MRPLLCIAVLITCMAVTLLPACTKSNANNASVVGGWRQFSYSLGPNQPAISILFDSAFFMWLNSDGSYKDTSYLTHFAQTGAYRLTLARSLGSIGPEPAIQFETKDSLGRTVTGATLQYRFMGRDTMILGPTDYFTGTITGTLYFVRLPGTSIAPQ